MWFAFLPLNTWRDGPDFNISSFEFFKISYLLHKRIMLAIKTCGTGKNDTQTPFEITKWARFLMTYKDSKFALYHSQIFFKQL